MPALNHEEIVTNRGAFQLEVKHSTGHVPVNLSIKFRLGLNMVNTLQIPDFVKLNLRLPKCSEAGMEASSNSSMSVSQCDEKIFSVAKLG